MEKLQLRMGVRYHPWHMTHSLLLILKLLVAVLIAAVGLGSTAADLTYLWRRPGLLLRSLLAMYLLVPLLALGMVLRLPLRAVAERLSEKILKLGGAVLALCGLVLLVANGGLLLEAGWPFLATLAVMTFGALAIGHLTGGPDPEDRTALAVCCATRHVGIAVLVAASVPGPRTAVLVAAYIVVSAVVSIPYLRWRRRATLTEGEPATRDG